MMHRPLCWPSRLPHCNIFPGIGPFYAIVA
jgi:hypothetical protein